MLNKLHEKFSHYLNTVAARGAGLAALFGLLPAILIFYAGYSMLIAPAFVDADTREKQVAALELEVANGRAVEANEPEFKREFKKEVQLFYDTLPLAPAETDLSGVMLGLQSVAARYKVELTGLNTVKIGQKTANADKLYEREIPATVVGSYDDVMRFFLDLARQTRILIVRDFKVSSATEKQKGARPQFVSVDFSLLAYHAPPTNEYPANIPADMLPEQMALTASNNGRRQTNPAITKNGE